MATRSITARRPCQAQALRWRPGRPGRRWIIVGLCRPSSILECVISGRARVWSAGSDATLARRRPAVARASSPVLDEGAATEGDARPESLAHGLARHAPA